MCRRAIKSIHTHMLRIFIFCNVRNAMSDNPRKIKYNCREIKNKGQNKDDEANVCKTNNSKMMMIY